MISGGTRVNPATVKQCVRGNKPACAKVAKKVEKHVQEQCKAAKHKKCDFPAISKIKVKGKRLNRWRDVNPIYMSVRTHTHSAKVTSRLNTGTDWFARQQAIAIWLQNRPSGADTIKPGAKPSFTITAGVLGTGKGNPVTTTLGGSFKYIHTVKTKGGHSVSITLDIAASGSLTNTIHPKGFLVFKTAEGKTAMFVIPNLYVTYNHNSSKILGIHAGVMPRFTLPDPSGAGKLAGGAVSTLGAGISTQVKLFKKRLTLAAQAVAAMVDMSLIGVYTGEQFIYNPAVSLQAMIQAGPFKGKWGHVKLSFGGGADLKLKKKNFKAGSAYFLGGGVEAKFIFKKTKATKGKIKAGERGTKVTKARKAREYSVVLKGGYGKAWMPMTLFSAGQKANVASASLMFNFDINKYKIGLGFEFSDVSLEGAMAAGSFCGLGSEGADCAMSLVARQHQRSFLGKLKLKFPGKKVKPSLDISVGGMQIDGRMGTAASVGLTLKF